MGISRRSFLAAAGGLVAGPALVKAAETTPKEMDLARQIGVTMSSFARLGTESGPKGISILDWPQIFRDELDMRVIDLNSAVLASYEPAYLERVRKAADDAGCVLTNLKINRSDIDIGNSDPTVREMAMAEVKRGLAGAGHLGLRWARPLPVKTRPNMDVFVTSYRELADYAHQRGVQMVVENYGWMDSDPDAVPKLLDAVGKGVAAAPDTGNWSDKLVRYAGLAKMFPRAVTCDFKAGKLGPNGEHTPWDLKKCFTIGWDAGFRGPWCLEHAGTDRKTLFRELAFLRDSLRGWMAERDAP